MRAAAGREEESVEKIVGDYLRKTLRTLSVSGFSLTTKFNSYFFS